MFNRFAETNQSDTQGGAAAPLTLGYDI